MSQRISITTTVAVTGTVAVAAAGTTGALL